MTCFFAVHTEGSTDPARIGSRGAGFSTESGVRTHARAEGPTRTLAGGAKLPFEITVSDNAAPVADPRTTRGAIGELALRAGLRARFPRRLDLENTYSLPLGAGFGVSGACALGATLATNEALGLGLSVQDCVAAAHIGEVRARSGLGDVVAQAAGGFEARVKEGAPPHGEVRTFPAPPVPLLVVSFGPIHTSTFLARKDRLGAVNAAGEDCLARLLREPSLPSAVRLGREFADRLGLISKAARQLLSDADGASEGTVAMLGDSLVFLDPPASLDGRARDLGARFVERTRLSLDGARVEPPRGQLG